MVLTRVSAFVTIRFLKFGFDVSFWPLVFSAIVLLPVYLSGSVGSDQFYRFTSNNLPMHSFAFWVVEVMSFFQFLYVLRRWWIEWELFIPLRYAFLEKGDAVHENYQHQYRHTCLVEYVPESLQNDGKIYDYFDSLFPGQIRRAELLLNTGYLSSLIKKRQEHIEGYEDTFAKKVHSMAQYLRKTSDPSNATNQIAKPPEPRIVVPQSFEGRKQTIHFRHGFVRDARTYETLPYHLEMIDSLNREIDEAFFRLTDLQQEEFEREEEGCMKKLLGLRYLRSPEDSSVWRECVAVSI